MNSHDARHQAYMRNRCARLAADYYELFAGKAPPKRHERDDRIIDFIARYAADPETRRCGELVTMSLRLAWGAAPVHEAFMRCLKGTDGFEELGIVSRTRLKNVGRGGLDLVIGHRDLPYAGNYGSREHDGTALVEGPLYEREFISRRLNPGETIDLDPHHAVCNLLVHNGAAHSPDYWTERSARPDRDDLQEVSYKIAMPNPKSGRVYTIESDGWRLGAEAAPYTPTDDELGALLPRGEDIAPADPFAGLEPAPAESIVKTGAPRSARSLRGAS